MSNPFKPGAGRIPPELAGRHQILAAFRSSLENSRATGEAVRPMVLYGLRGVGKTSLLTQIARDADGLGIVVAKIEAGNGTPLSIALAKQIHLALRRTMSVSTAAKTSFRRAAGALKSFQITVDPTGTYTFGVGVEQTTGVADSGDLAVDLQELLTELGSAAREVGGAVLVAIDELQTATESELNALNAALHGIGQGVYPVPIVFVGAGLPTVRAALSDANTYAERLYDYREIGLLTTGESYDALTVPTDGVVWDQDALHVTALETGGYPYALQTYGYHAIESIASPNRVTLDDVEIAVRAARDEMDRTVYGSRWDRVTDAQREYLTAMAPDRGAPSRVADISERLGKRAGSLSTTRDELIRGGFLYAPGRGFVAYTVPGMDRFIRRIEASARP